MDTDRLDWTGQARWTIGHALANCKAVSKIGRVEAGSGQREEESESRQTMTMPGYMWPSREGSAQG